ncbi:MAG: caspase family protein, partial [Deltaproteobacteria bacterium]|nr:caspase family protein [Deltaproteobacteria bacterium]
MARRALCIGINRFRDRDAPPLNGCVNDARNVAELLHGAYGFRSNDIRVLLDAQATRAAFLEGLEWLLGSARAGDQLVLFTSSHGSHIPDVSGDEDDGEDEVLIAHDHDWEGSVLVDDEIAQHIVRLPPGASLVSLWDTCHSGTLNDAGRAAQVARRAMRRPLATTGYREGITDVVGKYLPQPRGVDLRASLVGRRSMAGGPKAAPRRRPAAAAATVDTLTLGACRDDETAADASFDGRYAGAFTHALLKTVRERPDASWSDVFERTKREVKRGGFDQTPDAYGPPGLLGAPVFGGRGATQVAVPAAVVDVSALDQRIGQAEGGGRWEEAAAALEERGRRVTAAAEKVRTYEHLVSLYRVKLGDERRAVAAAEKLLAAVPTHAGARGYLRAMYTAMGNTAGLAALD